MFKDRDRSAEVRKELSEKEELEKEGKKLIKQRDILTKDTLIVCKSIGDVINKGKRVVGHGEYKEWARNQFGLSDRTIQDYSRVAKNWELVKNTKTIRKALKLIDDNKKKATNTNDVDNYDQLKNGYTLKVPKKVEVTIAQEDEDTKETPKKKEPVKPRFPTVIEKDGEVIRYHDKIHNLSNALKELEEYFSGIDIDNLIKVIQGSINDLALKRK